MGKGMGRVAVVTGGGSGIGEACVRELAAQGWRVVVTDVDAEAARHVAAQVGAQAMTLDVSDAERLEQVAAECEESFGPVVALVNSAGILQPAFTPEEMPLDLFDRVMAVNFRGTYLALRAFGCRMASRGQGSMVAIGSVTSLRAAPLHAYGPSKAAVVQMVQCLAAEWGRSGVRVNAISPGFVSTPALIGAIARGQRSQAPMVEGSAMGRMIDPAEIARVAAFLLSDEASAVTGVNLPVDAGWLVASHMATWDGVRGPR